MPTPSNRENGRMSHAVAVLVTAIFSMLFWASVSNEFDKGSVKAGYVIIDKTAYKLVKAE